MFKQDMDTDGLSHASRFSSQGVAAALVPNYRKVFYDLKIHY
jgi:hypothetical protein